MKRLSFPKKKRLVSNSQFKAVMAQGRRLSNGILTLYIAENGLEYSRLGVSVGKSQGNAVVRNRLKRLMREAFRQNQDRIPAGFDYLLMISPRWLKESPSDLSHPSTSLRVKDSSCRAKTRHEPRRDAKEPTFEQVETSFLALAKSLE
jgi:ribonuclease P protein component